MDINKKNGRGLIDITTHTQINGDLSIRTTVYSDAEADSDTDGD